MEVNVQKAVKMFFSNSSFEMIYSEAFANALDAGANEIRINISLPDPTQIQNLNLEISDNGVGFDDCRFGKFSKLFDVEEQSHKGLGRLVYLCYFERVYVESTYQGGTKKRTFTFNDGFNGENTVEEIEPCPCGSSFFMRGFTGERLYRNDNINPNHIKSLLMENFYMRLYKKRLKNKRIRVFITSHVGDRQDKAIVDTDDMPDFSILPLEHKLDLFNSVDLYYSVRETKEVGKKPITAIAVDDRCHKVAIIDDENLPVGYEMIFLLISESFQGAIDEARQNLTLSANDLGKIKRLFREGVANIINERFPRIAAANKKQEESLKNTYPHLSGYFRTSDIGFSSHNDILKDAQEQFFKDQREILSATSLSDEQYEKSLTLAARSLAEYILFRQNVISRMKALDNKNIEADLHNLIAPKGSEFKEGELYLLAELI